MRIGYFGGSFDPVHKGHITLANEIRQLAQLDQVILVPTRRSPHKRNQKTTSGQHRVRMLSLAIQGEEGLAIDQRELSREGLSYTYDTMREIKNERPGDDLFFLVGMDSLEDLPTWHRIDELRELVTFLVAVRPGHNSEAAAKKLEDSKIKFQILPTTAVDVSSTTLRRDLARGTSTNGLVAPEVGDYIRGEHLYKTTY